MTHSPSNSTVNSLDVPRKNVTGAIVSRTSLITPKSGPWSFPELSRCATNNVREIEFDAARAGSVASAAASGFWRPSFDDEPASSICASAANASPRLRSRPSAHTPSNEFALACPRRTLAHASGPAGNGPISFVTGPVGGGDDASRSEEHTSELQSHSDLVCRLLLEKKKKQRRPSRRSRKR